MRFKNFSDTAVKLGRNPAGIIALFIVLIYGIAALVTAFGSSLAPAERIPLVYFLVIFPVLVLGVFTWLAIRGIFYSVGEFINEDTFLNLIKILRFEVQSETAKHDSEDNFRPIKDENLQPHSISTLYKHTEEGGYDSACKYIEEQAYIHLKALNYRQLARFYYTKEVNKINCIKALDKYRDLKGSDPEVYRFLGYVYWRFGDIDAAIASTENALNLTSKYDWVDRDIHMFKIKDNLAYYYADKGINEEKAFSYVDQIDTFDFIDDIEKAKHLDTKGFVYMKFGKNKEDIQKSINCFTESLAVREDIDTDSSDVLFQRACLPISSPYLMKALHNQEVMDIHI